MTEEITRTAAGLTRRAALTGAAVAVTGFPFVSRGLAAQTLKFWQFYGPGGGVATQDHWFQDVVKTWNDAHEVKVELVYVPNNAYMDGTKLPTAFASGAGPDIFIISPGDFLRYYNGGVLLDLTPFMEAAARDDFFPSVIANRMVNGKIYGLPYEVEPMAMYYSIDAFNEVGLSEKDIPKTWDELLAVAKKLTTEKRFGVLFETNPGYYQNYTWYPFLWQAGGDFQSTDGKSAFNSPGTIAALKFWQDAVNMGVAPRKPLGGGGWDSVPNIGSGYCAMQNTGIWAISALREGAPKFKYGVFRLPTPPGGKYLTIGGGWAFVANARGSNPKAAGEFVAWALGSPKDGSATRIVDWCTKAKSDMPPTKSALEGGKAAFNEGFLKTFTDEVYPGARAEPRMPPQVYKAISDAIQSCQLNGTDPAQAAKTASDQIDQFLAGYKGAPHPLMQPSSQAKGASLDPGPRLTNRARERIAGYVFIAPDAIGLLIFVGGPMLLAFGLGFFSVSGFGEYTFTGLDNYKRMLGDGLFWRSLTVTMEYVVALVPALYVTGLGLALLVQANSRFNTVVRSLMFMPQTVSLVVVGLVWQVLLVDKIGLFNHFGSLLGAPSISWLGDPRFALSTVTFISVWFLMGFYMLIFLGGLHDIPREFYEAARIDGATPAQAFFRITLPLLQPTSFFVLLVSTVTAVCGSQTFDLIYVMTKGGPANSTQLVIFYIYQQAFLFNDYGYAAAMASVLVLVLMGLTVLMFALTRGGRFTYG